jgi:hypothetical protein
MTTARTKWSSTEVDTLVSILRSSPENLTKGFREFSQISGRPERAVMVKYYTQIRKQFPMFQIGNQKKNFSNTKNIMMVKENEVKEFRGVREGTETVHPMLTDKALKAEYVAMIKTLFKKFSETERLQIIKSLI